MTVKEVGITFDNNEAFINDEGRKNGEKATKIQKKAKNASILRFFIFFSKKGLTNRKYYDTIFKRNKLAR